MTSDIERFERSFGQVFDVDHAFSFWKARVAMYAILKALDIGEGDEVILPGYTCVMNVTPLKYLRVRPVYVDIEPQTFNIDPELIEDKITPKTRAIVAQHTYGYPCCIDGIIDIGRRHEIPVIEDCCLALGSTFKGQLVGTFGIASYFSFQWNKPFTTGLGGMALTSDPRLADCLATVRKAEAVRPSAREVLMLAAQLAVYRAFIYPGTTALAADLFRKLARKGAVVGSFVPGEFSSPMAPDFFKLLSGMQARAGLRQLRKLDAMIDHRRRMAALYDDLLASKGWQPRTYDKESVDPVMVRYPVRIADKDKALAEAGRNGIELGSWFECPLHPVETVLEAYGYTPGLCPIAEKASREVVNLPLHPRATEKTARKTVDFITRYTQLA